MILPYQSTKYPLVVQPKAFSYCTVLQGDLYIQMQVHTTLQMDQTDWLKYRS